MIWLRLVHIVAGVVWAGSAVFAAWVVLPTARAAGPEGGRFVGRLMQRMGPIMGIGMLLTVIPGFLLYGRLSAGFARAWVTSPQGLALSTGAIATLVAVLLGIVVNGAARGKMVALRKGLDAPDHAPDAAAARELARLQGRIERTAQGVAVLLLIAVGAMAIARYL